MATPTAASSMSFTLILSPFTPAGSNASTTTTTTTTTNAANSSSTYTSSYIPTGTSASEGACQYDAEHSNEDLRLPLALLYSLFFLLGLAGNVLALWVFLFLQARRPGAGGGGTSGRGPRHNSVLVLLINCAAADLVLLACLPFRVYYHLNGNRWGLGSVACRLVGNLFYMNMYISITLLGLIGLDRCLRLSGGRGGGVGASTTGRERDGRWRRSVAACGVIWALSLVMLVPMVAAKEGNERAELCFQYKQRRTAAGKAYFNLALVALFWAVFAALAVSYGRIAARLLRVRREQPGLPNAGRYGRTARKSFIVLFVFAVCFGPYHVFRPVYVASQLDPERWCPRAAAVDRTNEIMLLLSAFNSCLDPVMYFLLSGSVRKSAARVLVGRLGPRRLYFVSEATSVGSAVAPHDGGGGPAAPRPLEDLSRTSTTAGICPSDGNSPAEA